jgi:hypothetical protein
MSHQGSTVQMMSAIIRGSNVLPGNLKEVELNYFILKPHQELVLLPKKAHIGTLDGLRRLPRILLYYFGISHQVRLDQCQILSLL